MLDNEYVEVYELNSQLKEDIFSNKNELSNLQDIVKNKDQVLQYLKNNSSDFIDKTFNDMKDQSNTLDLKTMENTIILKENINLNHSLSKIK